MGIFGQNAIQFYNLHFISTEWLKIGVLAQWCLCPPLEKILVTRLTVDTHAFQFTP